jgi:hypothetical protein
VRLYTRHGTDFIERFPRIVEAIKGLPARSCFIDGEAIVVDQRRPLRLRPVALVASRPCGRALRFDLMFRRSARHAVIPEPFLAVWAWPMRRCQSVGYFFV